MRHSQVRTHEPADAALRLVDEGVVLADRDDVRTPEPADAALRRTSLGSVVLIPTGQAFERMSQPMRH